jgi:hypothetical protein
MIYKPTFYQPTNILMGAPPYRYLDLVGITFLFPMRALLFGLSVGFRDVYIVKFMNSDGNFKSLLYWMQ